MDATGQAPDADMLKEASRPLDIYGTVKIKREQLNDAEDSSVDLTSSIPGKDVMLNPNLAVYILFQFCF